MSHIISDKRILALVDESKVNDPESYIKSNIFNFIKVPPTIDSEVTHICTEIDIPNVYSSNNYYYKELVITIYVITHTNIMDVPNTGATRIDLISQYLDEMFNGQSGIGVKKLELMSNVSSAVTETQRARIIKFKALDRNVIKCGD